MSARRTTAAAASPRVTLAPGMSVDVTAGMSKGVRGIVVERWKDIASTPHWRIDLPDCRDRVIREDFLRPVVSA